MNKNTITRKACAKTNLFLRCCHKREDSFTEIETVFMPLSSVYDLLTFSFQEKEDILIECNMPLVPCDNRNLCWKAAEKYYKMAGLKEKGVHIYLQKNNPVAAGMGGGSSDAASTLLALQEYYNILSWDELYDIALSIGSDVPFFLDPEVRIGRGRGEILTPVYTEKTCPCRLSLPLLFAAPGFPVSAKWAYTHLDWKNLPESPTLQDMVKALHCCDIRKIQMALRNDLQQALLNKFPLLELLFHRFRDYGASPLISGSGPVVFALFEDEKAREKMWREEQEYFASQNIRFFKG